MKIVRTTLAVLAVLALVLVISAQQPAGKPARIAATDPALRLKMYDKHLEMEKTSAFKDAKWQFLGPVNVSGRCVDIAVVAPKGKSYTMFVATASGGLWKTVNEGTTWQPVFEKGPSTAIGAVALAPSDPNIVWIGTGEANIFRSSQSGIGVYKSVDGGKTWMPMGLAGTGTLIVFNKIDKVDRISLGRMADRYHASFISAAKREGIEGLVETIEALTGEQSDER